MSYCSIKYRLIEWFFNVKIQTAQCSSHSIILALMSMKLNNKYCCFSSNFKTVYLKIVKKEQV